MANPVRSTRFEDTAGPMLTHVVKVTSRQRTASRRGARPAAPAVVVSGLRCSIQPRSSFDKRTLVGRTPEMSHMMYCPGEDGNCVPLGIHLHDEVVDQFGTTYRVMNEPQRYPDFDTGGVHHLEIELQRVVGQ